MADNLSRSARDAATREIARLRNELRTADPRTANGSAHLWIAGPRNHRQDAVVEVFRAIAQAAPAS